MPKIQVKKLFIVGVMMAGLLGCGRGGYEFVPEQLVGIWETSHDKYSDRIFELRTDQIIFGTGEDTYALHMVVNVQETQDEGNALFTVYYLDSEGEESQFSFYDEPTTDTLRFKNQSRIEWTRSSASSLVKS